PLPDILADEEAQEVAHEVGDNGVPADRGEVEVAGRQLGYQGVPAAGVVVLYSTIGGMWSLTLTDIVQFLIMTVGLVFLLMPLSINNAAADQDRDPERQAEQDLHDG
ncbi:sodium:solute symporter family transporter, partial [Pseudomonas aeruginosa]